MTDFTPVQAENRYRIQTVYDAGQILKMIADTKEPVGPADIALTLSLSMNTAFRMCVTLEELGFLQKTGDRYTLGFGIGIMWARIKSSLEAARDQIDRDLVKIHIPEEK